MAWAGSPTTTGDSCSTLLAYECWLALLKETSLVSVIALDDILRQAYLASGQTKQPFLFYAAACTIYLLLTMLSSTVLIALERYANRGWGHAR